MGEYKIYSYTMVKNTMVQFTDMLPYCAVLLEDQNGHMIPAILDGIKDDAGIKIGQAVKAVAKADGTIIYQVA